MGCYGTGAGLFIGERLRKQIVVYLKATIFGTLAASAAMNVGAFAGHAWMIGPAVLFGLAIPTLIYLFTRIGAALWIDCHTRS